MVIECLVRVFGGGGEIIKIMKQTTQQPHNGRNSLDHVSMSATCACRTHARIAKQLAKLATASWEFRTLFVPYADIAPDKSHRSHGGRHSVDVTKFIAESPAVFGTLRGDVELALITRLPG
jgi:hypothetical protein